MEQDPRILKRPRPRPCSSNSKSSWSVGDIARAVINGNDREVTFAYKQKDGCRRYLVMADPETRKEIFAPDGETELALPAYDSTSLIKRGPRDPVKVALLQVHGYWDLLNFKLSDMERPELAGYFAQVASFSDEDLDLDTLERAGFKPPEFFIRQYQESHAAGATVQGSELVEPTSTVVPLSSQSAGPTASPVLTSTTSLSADKPHLYTSTENAAKECKQVPQEDGANGRASAEESAEVGGRMDGGGQINEDGRGEKGEASEEEEVENVLVSNRACNSIVPFYVQ